MDGEGRRKNKRGEIEWTEGWKEGIEEELKEKIGRIEEELRE